MGNIPSPPEKTLSAPVIRAASFVDVKAMTAIYAHHVKNGTASFETDPPNEAEMLKRLKEITEKRLPYLVAESDKKVVGYAYAGLYRPRLAYRYTVEDSIYVHPEHAGKGIGGHLLPALISQCEKLGLRQMVAVIGDSANVASVELHRKFGFEDVGVLKNVGFKFGKWLDTVFMQRALGEGSTTLPQK
jgi:phosphinothricin acetyltransferase